MVVKGLGGKKHPKASNKISSSETLTNNQGGPCFSVVVNALALTWYILFGICALTAGSFLKRRKKAASLFKTLSNKPLPFFSLSPSLDLVGYLTPVDLACPWRVVDIRTLSAHAISSDL
jgi:hypothetical protein